MKGSLLRTFNNYSHLISMAGYVTLCVLYTVSLWAELVSWSTLCAFTQFDVVSWEPEGHYHYSNIHKALSVISLKFDVSWEPEGRYQCSKMFHWEPEGRYHCTKSMAITPFWFSTESLWIVIAPFWFSTDDVLINKRVLQLICVQWWYILMRWILVSIALKKWCFFGHSVVVRKIILNFAVLKIDDINER